MKRPLYLLYSTIDVKSIEGCAIARQQQLPKYLNSSIDLTARWGWRITAEQISSSSQSTLTNEAEASALASVGFVVDYVLRVDDLRLSLDLGVTSSMKSRDFRSMV